MQIKKRGYSINPWRLVTSEGGEVYVKTVFEHPDLGKTLIDEAISGRTKTECTEKALHLLEKLLKTNGKDTLTRVNERCVKNGKMPKM